MMVFENVALESKMEKKKKKTIKFKQIGFLL